MLETQQTHERITTLLKEKGPSLPIQIAKALSINSLFISAFLSELVASKKVKTSAMKVGGSALYYLPGDETQLERFYTFLNHKEIEAYLLLKEKRILKDAEQDPAIRVALRSLRDFAIGFKNQEEIYWRYFLVTEEEASTLLNPPKQKEKQEQKKEKERERTERKENPKSKKKEPESFQNPLVTPESKPEQKKEKQKSEFAQKAVDVLKKNYTILEEKDYKAKEYTCITRINSQLGPMPFYTQAKDKKTITEADIKKLLATAQAIPLPALLLYTGTISKKAQELAETYTAVLKMVEIP